MYEKNQMGAAQSAPASYTSGAIASDASSASSGPPPVGQMLGSQYELAIDNFNKSAELKSKICGETPQKEGGGSPPTQSYGPTKDLVISTIQILHLTRMNLLAIEAYVLG